LFQKLEVFMPLTVVLAVCLDSTSLAIHDSDWKSAGYIVTAAGSIREATERFKAGDFDLVLLGHSIAPENRERLTFLIRASGSRVPVASIGKAVGDCDTFADATFGNEPTELLLGMGELVARSAKILAMRKVQNDLPAFKLPRSA
jgi:DNA-binding NtrC family response regulator